MQEHQAEPPAVGLTQPIEASVEGVKGSGGEAVAGRTVVAIGVACRLAREQIAHKRRNQCAREQVRREHGEDDGHRQGDEEASRSARDEHDGDEDDADAQRRDERGDRDLLGTVEDGAKDGLSLSHVSMNVLDLDGGIVHEDPDREGHAPERHHVERVARARTGP